MRTPNEEVRTAVLRVLNQATEPLTASEVFDKPAIRELFPNLNRVSDYLGYMYRKGMLTREFKPMEGDQRHRWGYRLRAAQREDAPGAEIVVMNRAGILITDDGKNVTIVSGDVRIVVTSRS